MNKIKLFFISSVVLALFIAGCSLDAPTEKQTVLKPGTADFSRYVALGNSITAGFQSGALTEKHQVNSYPNLLAKQMGVSTFAQPLLAYPGLGSFTADSAGILELVMLASPTTGNPVITPVPYDNYQAYTTMPYVSVDVAQYAAPYNNLGMPGTITYDVMNAYSAATSPTQSPFIDIVLRNIYQNPPTTLTAFQQAKALQPTFITCWIGNNDVLGYATSGGTNPAAPTPVGDFTALYSVMLDSLRLNLADTTALIVANIPDVTAIPYFTTIPYMVNVPGVTDPVALWIQASDGVRQATAADLILLPASSVIGDTTGAYGPQGYPVGIIEQVPLPNLLVLDEAEVEIAQEAVVNFNLAISDLAEARLLWVVDIYGVLNRIKGIGFETGGQDFSADYITGGIFSLDGVHPSDIGHGIIANEFINVINAKFGASVPPVNIIDLADKVSLKMKNMNVKIPGPDAFKSVIAACGGSVE